MKSLLLISFVVVNISATDYNFSGNVYLKNLCVTFGEDLPKTNDDCGRLLSEIAGRYCSGTCEEAEKSLLNSVRRAKVPDNELDWKMFFNALARRYKNQEQLLIDLQMDEVPRNVLSWMPVEKCKDQLYDNIVCKKVKEAISKIFGKTLKNENDYINAFNEFATLYPFIPKTKNTAILEYFGFKNKDNNYTDYEKCFFSLADKYIHLEEILSKFREERNLYRSLIDLNDVVEELFGLCWPSWAPIRTTPHYTSEDWRILFLNVEHDGIRKLKVNLISCGLNETQFVREISFFLKSRIKEAHAKLSLNEKSETYADFFKQLSSEYTKVAFQALLFPSLIQDPNSINVYEEEAIKPTKAIRSREYRLLKIPKFNQPQEDDSLLKRTLNEFTKKYNEMNPTSYYNGPLLTFKGSSGSGYALFQNFSDAHIAWEGKEYFDLSHIHRDTMIIESVYSSSSLDNDVSTVSVEVYNKEQLNDVAREVIGINQDLEPKSCYEETKSCKLYCVFKKGIDALSAYLKYKNIKNVKDLCLYPKFTVKGATVLTTTSSTTTTETTKQLRIFKKNS